MINKNAHSQIKKTNFINPPELKDKSNYYTDHDIVLFNFLFKKIILRGVFSIKFLEAFQLIPNNLHNVKI